MTPYIPQSAWRWLALGAVTVINLVVLLAGATFAWCSVTGRDPGPAGQHLLELARLLLEALP